MKTNNDIYDILFEIKNILKESNNNSLEIFELSKSNKNNLPLELNLNDFENMVIKKMDKGININNNILTGEGKVKISWKK